MKLTCEFTVAYAKKQQMLEELCRMLNTTMYTGYDLLADMATSDKFLNGVYMEFINGAAVDPSPVSPTRDRSYYADLEDPGYGGSQGYCRVPLAMAPTFSSTAAEYQSNKATVVAVTDPVSASLIQVIDGVSNFFTVALVHMPDINDPSQDIVYNVAVMKKGGVFAPVLKPANIQVGVTATVKFEAP